MRSSIARAIAVILLGLCGAAAPVHAGVCLGEEEANADMKLVEAFARDKSTAAEIDKAYGWLCVQGDAQRLKARILKACGKILDRDGDKDDGFSGSTQCAIAVAATGTAKLGDHDIFARILKLPEDPIESSGGVGWTKTALLGRIGDPRGAAVIVEMWTTAIPRADKREKRHGVMADWSSWRQTAAASLGMIGGAAEATFLEEQAKLTKDKHVAEACHDGAAAITKRVK